VDPDVKKLFVPPFTAHGPEGGAPIVVSDRMKNTVATAYGTGSCWWMPRGWGRHQYMEDGEALHDAWCAFFRALVGDERDAVEVVRRLNEAWSEVS